MSAAVVFAGPTGVLTQRQQLALQFPCRDPREYGACDFRRVETIGVTRVVSVLTFDWFAKSKPVWHAAIAVIRNGDYVTVDRWDHNDKTYGISVLKSLTAGVGFGPGQNGGWVRFSGIGCHFYRPATVHEQQVAKMMLAFREPLPPPMIPTGVPEIDEVLIYERSDDERKRDQTVGTLGMGEGPDRAGSSEPGNITIRKSRAEKIE